MVEFIAAASVYWNVKNVNKRKILYLIEANLGLTDCVNHLSVFIY